MIAKPNRIRPCAWVEDENGVWETSCGHAFELNEGTPSENELRFCGYCGKLIKEKAYVDEEARL